VGELLGAAEWACKIYSGGWVDAGGRTFASVEPATGRPLAEIGSAAIDHHVGAEPLRLSPHRPTRGNARRTR
jgi:hypothetical protein